jgi:hypothetical protein
MGGDLTPVLHRPVELAVKSRHGDKCGGMSVLPPKANIHLAVCHVRFGPLHSISSSASAKKLSGIFIPSDLAVFALMTNSNLVGCITGTHNKSTPSKAKIKNSRSKCWQAVIFVPRRHAGAPIAGYITALQPFGAFVSQSPRVCRASRLPF